MQKSFRNRKPSKRASGAKAARGAKTAGQSARPPARKRASKQTRLLDLLRRPAGATVAALSEASGWQQHSVGCCRDPPVEPASLIVCSAVVMSGLKYCLASSS
jgi:hypothetical protein